MPPSPRRPLQALWVRPRRGNSGGDGGSSSRRSRRRCRCAGTAEGWCSRPTSRVPPPATPTKVHTPRPPPPTPQTPSACSPGGPSHTATSASSCAPGRGSGSPLFPGRASFQPRGKFAERSSLPSDLTRRGGSLDGHHKLERWVLPRRPPLAPAPAPISCGGGGGGDDALGRGWAGRGSCALHTPPLRPSLLGEMCPMMVAGGGGGAHTGWRGASTARALARWHLTAPHCGGWGERGGRPR